MATAILNTEASTATGAVPYVVLDPQYERRLARLLANTRYTPARPAPAPADPARRSRGAEADDTGYLTCNADAWPTPYAVDTHPALLALYADLALTDAV